MAVSLSSCKDKTSTTRFRLLTPEQTGIQFANTITENDSINLLDYEYIYNGGGVAVVDVNDDDLPDLFFTGNMVPSKLYLNEGGMRFRDITSSAGITKKNWATGVAVGDVNGDGLQDIYVCSAGHLDKDARANLLYINNGNNTFTESAFRKGTVSIVDINKIIVDVIVGDIQIGPAILIDIADSDAETVPFDKDAGFS